MTRHIGITHFDTRSGLAQSIDGLNQSGQDRHVVPSSHLLVRESRLGVVYYWGLATGREIIDEARKLLSHPDVGPGYCLLWDASSMESLDLTIDEMGELTRLVAELGHRVGRGRSAVVVKLPDAVATANLFKALAPPEIGRVVRLFKDPVSALRWLAAERVRFSDRDNESAYCEGAAPSSTRSD